MLYGAKIRCLSFGVIWVLFALCVSATQADTQSVRPGINAPYQQPDVRQWVERFENEGREVFDRRDEIIRRSGVKPGMRIADVGAGTGLFTRLFARAVGEQGSVFAVDITPEFIRHIEDMAQQQHLRNIITMLSDDKDTHLTANSVDIVFVCDTYHHFEYPQAMLSSIHRALKPNGKLIIIDFEKIPGKSTGWVMQHVRADKQTVIDEVVKAGFRLVGEESGFVTNYYLNFNKR